MESNFNVSQVEQLFNTQPTSAQGPYAYAVQDVIRLVITNAVGIPANVEKGLSACIELTVVDSEGVVGTTRVYDYAVKEWFPALRSYLPASEKKLDFIRALQYLVSNHVAIRFFIKRGGFASKPNFERREG